MYTPPEPGGERDQNHPDLTEGIDPNIIGTPKQPEDQERLATIFENLIPSMQGLGPEQLEAAHQLAEGTIWESE